MDALQILVTDLNTLIPILNHWLHLSAAVIWVGGLAFLIMAVTRGSRRRLQKSRSSRSPMRSTNIIRKSRDSAPRLLFTGGVNFHYVNQLITSQTGSGIQHHAKYLTIFFIKLFLVLCLLTLFLYTVLFKSDDAEKEKDPTKRSLSTGRTLDRPLSFSSVPQQ